LYVCRVYPLGRARQLGRQLDHRLLLRVSQRQRMFNTHLQCITQFAQR